MSYNQEELNNMHHDPDNWKWGFLYFNPRDERIVVLKRHPGMGMTLNFGNRKTGLFLIGVLVAVTAMLLIRDFILA